MENHTGSTDDDLKVPLEEHSKYSYHQKMLKQLAAKKAKIESTIANRTLMANNIRDYYNATVSDSDYYKTLIKLRKKWLEERDKIRKEVFSKD